MHRRFRFEDLDIGDTDAIEWLFLHYQRNMTAIVQTAAQPGADMP
jgi:hypothetical protein